MSFYLPRANDRRVPTVERIIARLGKTRMNLVDEVSNHPDDQAIYVVLKNGFISRGWNETAHIFPLENFSDYTQAEYFEELIQWFATAERINPTDES
tara:strand:- start:1399 stop:1689 length:291 start_codon:yes stop_codon:yes gene_type:complete